jgi:hypothetical protein
MPMNVDPVEPMAPLTESMAAMHEMYLSFVEGGFTPEDAIKLLAEIIVRQGRQ